MALELTALESSRQRMEQVRTERLERLRFERAELERQRIDEQRAGSLRATRELAEQAALENVQGELQANRIEANSDAQLDRLRADDVLATTQNDRFLAERARIEAPLAYAAQTPRVDAYAQPDILQAERIQSTRDAIERADSSRIDRVEFSDRALTQVQFAY